MATIEQQLAALADKKNQLVGILNAAGIKACKTETFTTLIDKAALLAVPHWREMAVTNGEATAWWDGDETQNLEFLTENLREGVPTKITFAATHDTQNPSVAGVVVLEACTGEHLTTLPINFDSVTAGDIYDDGAYTYYVADWFAVQVFGNDVIDHDILMKVVFVRENGSNCLLPQISFSGTMNTVYGYADTFAPQITLKIKSVQQYF